MSEELIKLRARLEEASKQRGTLAQIALATSVTSRTIYSVMRAQHEPNASTISKLAAYFKKADRKAAAAEVSPAQKEKA